MLAKKVLILSAFLSCYAVAEGVDPTALEPQNQNNITVTEQAQAAETAQQLTEAELREIEEQILNPGFCEEAMWPLCQTILQ